MNQSGLKFVHLNVGSLLVNSRIEQLRLQLKQNDFDIFGLSESWLTESIPNGLVQIEGYNISRLDRGWTVNNSRNIKKGGGLLCYTKKRIQISETKFSKLNYSSQDLELQCTAIQIPN